MRRTTIHVLTAALAAHLACGAALADELIINNIRYPGVRVTDVAKLKISYQISGAIREKNLSDVTAFTIDTSREFNKAEQAFKAGKAADAVAAYTEAEAAAGSRTWLKRLVRYRRCQAAAAAKMPGQAVTDWLAILDEAGATAAAVALAPDAPAAKGSGENARAIALLEKRLSSKDDPAVQAGIRDLLLSLYGVEGLNDKAMLLRGSAPGPGDGTAGEKPGPAPPVGPSVDIPVSRAPAKLQKAVNQIKLGNYAAAVADIDASLKRFNSTELPGALLLRGKALQMAYEKGGKKDRSLLAKAGLSFMKVAACFDASTPEAPEALYFGAMVSRQLGNEVAAGNAFRLLISRHEGTDWAKRAKQALGS